MSLQARKAQILKELAEIEEVLTRGRARAGDTYHYISPEGVVFGAIENSAPVDADRVNVGNYFLSREEAEHARECLTVKQELKALTKGFKPDWSDVTQSKHFIFYDYVNESWNSDWYYGTLYPDAVYFATKEDAQEAIKTLGPRLNVFIKE